MPPPPLPPPRFCFQHTPCSEQPHNPAQAASSLHPLPHHLEKNQTQIKTSCTPKNIRPICLQTIPINYFPPPPPIPKIMHPTAQDTHKRHTQKEKKGKRDMTPRTKQKINTISPIFFPPPPNSTSKTEMNPVYVIKLSPSHLLAPSPWREKCRPKARASNPPFHPFSVHRGTPWPSLFPPSPSLET